MTQSLHTKKILVLSALMLAALIAVYAIFFMNIKAENEQSALHAGDIANMVASSGREATLRTFVTAVTPELNKLNSYLVPKDGAVAFIEELEGLGKTAGVSAKITSLDLDADAPGAPDQSASSTNAYQDLHIAINAGGSWQDVMYFLDLFESLPYNIHIDRLAVHTGLDSVAGFADLPPPPGAPKGTTWSVSITFTVPQHTS